MDNTSRKASIWNKDVQSIITVKDMTRSRFFWCIIFALLSFCLFISNKFFGIQSFEMKRIGATFDLNLLKIVSGFALLLFVIEFLHGKGRIVGGFVTIFVALLIRPSITGNIDISIQGVPYELPLGDLYFSLFIFLGYLLWFYSESRRVGKWDFICSAVGGILIFSSYVMIRLIVVAIDTFQLSPLEIALYTETQIMLAFGSFFLLFGLIFLWPRISQGQSFAFWISEAFYWLLLLSVLTMLLPMPICFIFSFIESTKESVEKILPLGFAWVILATDCWCVILLSNLINKRMKRSQMLSDSESKDSFKLMSILKRAVWFVFFVVLSLGITYNIQNAIGETSESHMRSIHPVIDDMSRDDDTLLHPTNENIDLERLIGTYEGKYVAIDGYSYEVTLDVYKDNENYEAIFHCRLNPISASWHCEVEFDIISSTYSITGVNWIDRPSEFWIMDDFNACNLSDDGNILSGTVSGANNDFEIYRVNTEF